MPLLNKNKNYNFFRDMAYLQRKQQKNKIKFVSCLSFHFKSLKVDMGLTIP